VFIPQLVSTSAGQAGFIRVNSWFNLVYFCLRQTCLWHGTDFSGKNYGIIEENFKEPKRKGGK